MYIDLIEATQSYLQHRNPSMFSNLAEYFYKPISRGANQEDFIPFSYYLMEQNTTIYFILCQTHHGENLVISFLDKSTLNNRDEQICYCM